ncbi:hypothetical protein ACWGOQ_0000760 [Aquimarina sp. M1]
MKINWINGEIKDSLEAQSLLNLEYNFRRLITKALLRSTEEVDLEDLSLINLNFCLKQKLIEVSPKTPEPFYSNISKILVENATSILLLGMRCKGKELISY